MPSNRLRLVAANGQRLQTFGQETFPFRPDGGAPAASMSFEVADICKPLASAARVVAAGNVIHFEAAGGRSLILNPKIGKRIPSRVENGTYLFDAMFGRNVLPAVPPPPGLGNHGDPGAGDAGFHRRGSCL